jgi:hypothetical protein
VRRLTLFEGWYRSGMEYDHSCVLVCRGSTATLKVEEPVNPDEGPISMFILEEGDPGAVSMRAQQARDRVRSRRNAAVDEHVRFCVFFLCQVGGCVTSNPY